MYNRKYLEASHVSSLLDFFPVPKGDSDIAALWAPNFFLPSASSAAMLLLFNTWMADMDFGERQVHNFPMQEDRLRKCSGVEWESGKGRRSISCWTRLFMGLRLSPYWLVQYYYWGEEFARGDPSKLSNPMRYDRIRLNLPGSNAGCRYSKLIP